MSQNKTKLSEAKIIKYVSYALGEIFLVVVGILIAVQINNWYRNNSNRSTATEYLMNISSDLTKDTAVFGQSITYIDQIIEVKKKGLAEVDSLPIEYLNAIVISKYFNLKVNDAAYIGMKDPDVLGISKFKEVFTQIHTYYTFHQNYLDNFSEWEVSSATRESVFWNEQGEFEISLLNPMIDSIQYTQISAERKRKIVAKMKSIKGRNFIRL